MKSYVFATRGQALGALIKAPVVPVALLFAWDALDRAMAAGPLAIVGAAILSVYILVLMEVASLVIGGLVLVALWKRTAFNIALTSMLGGFIASLPLLAILLLPTANYDAWIDGKPTVVGGQKTSFGYWQDFQTLAAAFGFGCVGGASFWWFGRPKVDKSSNTNNDR